MFAMNNGIPVMNEEQESIVVIITYRWCQTDTMHYFSFYQ